MGYHDEYKVSQETIISLITLSVCHDICNNTLVAIIFIKYTGHCDPIIHTFGTMIYATAHSILWYKEYHTGYYDICNNTIDNQDICKSFGLYETCNNTLNTIISLLIIMVSLMKYEILILQ